MALADHWPLLGLRVRTPRLELRFPDGDLLAALLDVALAGIHDPASMPFLVAWTDAPRAELPQRFLQYHWGQHAALGPERWALDLVALVDGEVIGTQGLLGEAFASRRTVSSGSWLGRRFQGQGFGSEMRRAVLHLAFAGLGATRAETAAWDDNEQSLRVTRSMGYVPNGDSVALRRGEPARMHSFVLDRDTWVAGAGRRAAAEVELEGVEPCLALLGAA